MHSKAFRSLVYEMFLDHLWSRGKSSCWLRFGSMFGSIFGLAFGVSIQLQLYPFTSLTASQYTSHLAFIPTTLVSKQ